MRYDFDQALEIFGRIPTVLSALLGDLSRGWLVGNEGEATWSPMSVVAHLVHGERTDWIARARTIIEKGEAEVFAPFDRFAHLEEARTRTNDVSLRSVLRRFCQIIQRRHHVA